MSDPTNTQPPPPATGTPARTLAATEAITLLWPAFSIWWSEHAENFDHAKAVAQAAFEAGWKQARAVQPAPVADEMSTHERFSRTWGSNPDGSPGWVTQAPKPAPIAADGTGPRFQNGETAAQLVARVAADAAREAAPGDSAALRTYLLDALHPLVRRIDGAADGAGRGERRWGVVQSGGQLHLQTWLSPEAAEQYRYTVLAGVGRVVRITVLADDAGAEGAAETHPPATADECDAALLKYLTPADGYGINADKWREELATDLRTVGCDWLHWFYGTFGNIVGQAVGNMAVRLAAAEARADKLQAFKFYVHLYLDTHGVPHHPPGPHGAEGCRIGDRMDWLMAKLAGAEAARAAAEAKARQVEALLIDFKAMEIAKENVVLGKALEWYADEMNYQWAGATGRVPAAADNGARARAALAAPAGGAAGRDGGNQPEGR